MSPYWGREGGEQLGEGGQSVGEGGGGLIIVSWGFSASMYTLLERKIEKMLTFYFKRAEI